MTYYAYKENNEIDYLVYMDENGVPYAYESGEWVFRPGLASIRSDVGDDAVKITEQEAQDYIKATK